MASDALKNFISDDDDEMVNYGEKETSSIQSKPVVDANDESARQAYDRYAKIRDYQTNTKNMNVSEFSLINPESNKNVNADRELQNSEKEYFDELTKRYADPVIAQAADRIEKRTGKKLSYQDFDKLCRTYAAELVQIDAKNRGRDPNPVDYRNYYEQLIQNRKVVPAYINNAQRIEKGMVDEIFSLMQRHKINDSRTIHIEQGSSINIRHKGKVSIRDDSHNREITINNGADVKLLHMQYRKDFLDKRYREEVTSGIDTGVDANGEHSSDGFE